MADKARMTTQSWERCCAWRAVESGDTAGRWLSHERREMATAQCRGDLVAKEVDVARMQPGVMAFLQRRAGWLSEAVRDIGNPPQLASWLRELRVLRVPGWWLWVGAVASFLGGFFLTQFGNEKELNLLALPLIGLLVWNGVIMAVSLVLECLPVVRPDFFQEEPGPSWVVRYLQARVLGRRSRNEDEMTLPEGIRSAFEGLTGDTGEQMLLRQLRGLLHLGAALVGLGAVSALFARGWAVEYRVVWESTLLDEESVSGLFGTIFAPASRVFGVAIPLDDLAAARRGEGLQTVTADALPWLKLYAGTLLLGVVSPRLMLFFLALARRRQLVWDVLREQAWGGYAQRLLRRLEGGGEALLVVTLGDTLDGRVQRRWADWLMTHFGGRSQVELLVLAGGEEDDWVESWEPRDGRLVLSFFMASTPEAEVHGALLRGVWQRLREAHLEPEIHLVLDASGLAQRWSAEQIQGRWELWETLAGEWVEEMWLGSEKGLSRVG